MKTNDRKLWHMMENAMKLDISFILTVIWYSRQWYRISCSIWWICTEKFCHLWIFIIHCFLTYDFFFYFYFLFFISFVWMNLCFFIVEWFYKKKAQLHHIVMHSYYNGIVNKTFLNILIKNLNLYIFECTKIIKNLFNKILLTLF